MGDYDNGGKTMKGKEPIMTKRLRNKLREQNYKVYLINEFRTSKLCSNCFSETEKFIKRESRKPKDKGKIIEVFGCLRCKNANCKKQTNKIIINKSKTKSIEKRSIFNRDVNSCLNMQTIVRSLKKTNKRPIQFTRQTKNLNIKKQNHTHAFRAENYYL